MKGRLRRAITVLLVVLLVLGAGAFGAYWYQARQSAQAIEEAQRLAELPEPEPPADQQPAEPQEEPEQEGGKNPSVPAFRDARAAALLKLDLDSLRAINEDVIGWIEIPGTPLSYPLLQGEDNAYYLNHSWNRQYNAGGSIFLEQSSRADFSDFNTIIYGHRMSDSSMFNSLRHYADETYWQEHPRVYIEQTRGYGSMRCLRPWRSPLQTRSIGWWETEGNTGSGYWTSAWKTPWWPERQPLRKRIGSSRCLPVPA